MTEKEKLLIEIMDEEDMARVKRGEKPLYQSEDEFFENHPNHDI